MRLIGSVCLQNPNLGCHLIEHPAVSLGGRRSFPVVCVSGKSSSSGSSSTSWSIHKSEPFQRKRSLIETKEPSLIQKTQNDIADYCCSLEGDECYSCWKAYFELQDLEKEAPKREVEIMIQESGGIKSLISWLHGVAGIWKSASQERQVNKCVSEDEEMAERSRHISDGLPKTKEEIEEEEKALMPDSPFTRLLRSKGTYPAWYTPRPDHETD